MERTILHVDMDAFFAAVEQRDRPELKGKPVVVGAAADKRGVVAAASYEAREYGIRSAMPSREAGRRCPEAVFLPVDGPKYRDVSEKVFDIFRRFTPFVEPLSIDEAFLDVTGAGNLFGTGREIAIKIRDAVKTETSLTASVGVAPNKFLAKLASDLDKPDGLVIVPRDEAGIVAFLAPLSVSRIWGVGKVTRRALERAGIKTIGDLQKSRLEDLAGIVGLSYAEHIQAMARGRDDRDIDLDAGEISMSREHTFPDDCSDRVVVEGVLFDLVESVGRRLRKAGKYAGLAHVKVRWKDFRTITRQKPFSRPCCDDHTLRETASVIFGRQKWGGAVRLIGFGVSRLQSHPETESQLDLFDPTSQETRKHEDLSRTVDAIRDKFGPGSIDRASREASD